MAKAFRGTPCWYELSTTDLAGAQTFYGNLLGWTVANAGLPGFDYRLASSADARVAGMMPVSPMAPQLPQWRIYIAVTNCEAAVKSIVKAGGSTHQPPTDIPGTGRFALVADPQGAGFGILQPLDGDAGGAFDQRKLGHGCWHELMTSDPAAAMAFYTRQFGWKPGDSMDMGPMGSYDLFRRGKADIGGMMRQAPGMPGPDHPFWLPYFGTDGVEAAIGRVWAAGGQVLHGPREVPGGGFIMLGQDPQGAHFALAGPK
jgi:predicted enzyme related to lactoylglutathione lyase